MSKLLRFTSCLLLLAAARANAQTLADYDYENLAFRGVGFDYGQIWPTKVNATSIYSVRLDLGFLGPGVRVAPNVSYWGSRFRASELQRLATQINRLPALRGRPDSVSASDLGTIKWSDLGVGMDLHLLWTTPVNIMTYVGVGGSVHVLNGRGDFIQDTFVEDLLDSTAAGVSLIGGLEFQPVARFRVYGEARYTIVSDVRYPGLRIGGALMLPPRETATGSR